MKNLLSVVALFVAVFAISCSSNPVESEAYKKMAAGLEELKTNYTTLAGELNNLEPAAAEMNAAVGTLATPDSSLNAIVAQYGEVVAMSKEINTKHAEMMNAQAELMKSHATKKMEEITTDFTTMTSEYEQMMADVNSIKEKAAGLTTAYQTAFAAAQAAATTPANNKK